MAHWLISSLAHGFMGSLAHWLIGSLVHWFIRVARGGRVVEGVYRFRVTRGGRVVEEEGGGEVELEDST